MTGRWKQWHEWQAPKKLVKICLYTPEVNWPHISRATWVLLFVTKTIRLITDKVGTQWDPIWSKWKTAFFLKTTFTIHILFLISVFIINQSSIILRINQISALFHSLANLQPKAIDNAMFCSSTNGMWF